MIRYYLTKDKSVSEKDFNEFIKLVELSLKDITKKSNIKYKKSCIQCSHIHVILASTDFVNKIFPKDNKNDEKDIEFSWTDQSCNIIMINYDNWKNKKISNDNQLYKKYVIQHEFLHAFPFFLNHTDEICNKENNNYNVMYQQTRNASDTKINKIQDKICNPIINIPFLNSKNIDFNISMNMKKKKKIEMNKIDHCYRNF